MHLSTQLSEYMKGHIYSNYGISTVKKEMRTWFLPSMGALTTHKVASSQLAWCFSWYFIAPVSQRSWVWIPFRPQFFSGFNFTTALISRVFMIEWYHATHSRHKRQALGVRVQPVFCTQPLAIVTLSPNLKILRWCFHSTYKQPIKVKKPLDHMVSLKSIILVMSGYKNLQVSTRNQTNLIVVHQGSQNKIN